MKLRRITASWKVGGGRKQKKNWKGRIPIKIVIDIIREIIRGGRDEGKN